MSIDSYEEAERFIQQHKSGRTQKQGQGTYSNATEIEWSNGDLWVWGAEHGKKIHFGSGIKKIKIESYVGVGTMKDGISAMGNSSGVIAFKEPVDVTGYDDVVWIS